tara:strand:+ start:566 stop:799 length:234 start_codon:yes stop_codon:yes gene_type:complete
MAGQSLLNKRKDNKMRDYDKERDNLYDYLVEYGHATEEEIRLVTSINGYSLDSLESILYSRTGYRTLEQIEEMEPVE